MADTPENSTGPSSIQVRNIRADRTLSREISVQRMTVNTDEERDAASDLLQEVRDVLEDQTSTLDGTLRKIENINQMQLNALRGMAGDTTDTKKSLQSYQTAIKDAIRQGFDGLADNIDGLASGMGGGGGGGSGSGGEESNTEQTKELNKTLENLRQAIVALAANEAVGGGGDGDGGSGGGGVGDSAARARRFNSAQSFADLFFEQQVNEAGDEIELTFGMVANSFREFNRDGIIQQMRGNLINFADALQSASANLLDSSNITSYFTTRFTEGLDMARTGSINLLETFVPEFIRAGDNLKDTFALVRDSIEGDVISPIGLMGDNLNMVSQNLRDARLELRDGGNSAVNQLSFTAANEAMVQLYALERRRNQTADIRDAETRRTVDSQLNFASMIARNTGRTADEVIKMNAQASRDLANLEAGGALRGSQRQNFQDAIGVFRNDPNLAPFADMLSGIARSGGNTGLYLSQNQDMAQDLAVMQNMPQLQALMDVINNRGGMSEEDYATALNRAAGSFGPQGFMGETAAAAMSDNGFGIAGAANFARDFQARGEQDGPLAFVNRAIDTFANVIPRAEVAMVAALGANTLAVLQNTLALGGGGLLRGLIGGVKGFLGRGLGAVAAGLGAARAGAGGALGAARAGAGGLARGLGAGVTGAGAALGAMGRGGAGLARGAAGAGLRAIPGLGAIAGLGYGAYKLFQGDLVGAGLSAGAGLAGLVPGVGTAGSLGLSAALAAHEMGAFGGGEESVSPPPVGPTTGAATTNAGIRNDTQRLLLEQNRLMDRVITILEEQSDVFDRIETNTGVSTASVDAGFLDGLFGRGDDVRSSG